MRVIIKGLYIALRDLAVPLPGGQYSRSYSGSRFPRNAATASAYLGSCRGSHWRSRPAVTYFSKDWPVPISYGVYRIAIAGLSRSSRARSRAVGRASPT